MSSESKPSSSVIVYRELMRSTGYAHGFSQPSLMYRVQRADSGAVPQVDLAMRCLEDAIGKVEVAQAVAQEAEDPVIAFMITATNALLPAHNHPVFSRPKIWKNHKGGSVREWAIAQPCLDLDACRAAIDFSAQLLALSAATADETTIRSASKGVYEKAGQRLRNGGAAGFNTLHFLTAAHRLGIPWRRIEGNVFQLGQGRHLRWLDSSFTDKTPHLSVVLAKNKMQAASVMRASGIPVPAHERARSPEQAEQIAQRLGLPVVVKPADCDGGVGVSAFLTDLDAVKAAYVRAATHSKQVIVEKHVAGQDYRIQVVEGQVHGVIYRAPGGVVGDGVQTVRQLIEEQNQQRASATDDRKYLHPIKPDAEADMLLKNANLSMNSVVPKGQWVRLRGAANVASGGAPVQIPLDDVHPDNLQLAIRATASLGLDVAGVDLLIPDIGTSWHTSGASVCEVNAQPQMFTTLHEPALKKMFDGVPTRIPVVVVLLNKLDSKLGQKLHEAISKHSQDVGLVSHDGVFIGSERIQVVTDNSAVNAGVEILLRNRAVRAAVVCYHDFEDVRTGWPFDQCDALIVDGMEWQGVESNGAMAKLINSVKVLSPRMLVQYDDQSTPATTCVNANAQVVATEDFLELDALVKKLSVLWSN